VSDPLGWNWPFTNHVGGGLGGDVTVDPGKSYTEKLLINQWCAFSKPGTYQITCKRTLNVILSSQRDPNSHIRLDSTMPSIPVETTLEITLEDNPSAQAAYLAGLTPVLIRYDVSTQEAGKQIKDVSEQFRSLAQAQTAAAFPEIVKLLDGPPAVQVDAVQWLSYYPSSEAGPVLLAHAPKLLPEARLSALQSLSNWNTPGVEPLLATTLSDQDHELRANAVLICSKKWYASCVPILLTMGDDPDPIVRRYLGAALGASGDQQAIPVLLKLLHDPDSDLLIKTWAAVGLGKFKHMEGVPVLIDLLHDPDASRYGVIDILSQLTGQDFNDNSNTCLDWWAKTGRAQYGNQ
jgi:HEAT repeat protein